jgi:hypothetical protein
VAGRGQTQDAACRDRCFGGTTYARSRFVGSVSTYIVVFWAAIRVLSWPSDGRLGRLEIFFADDSGQRGYRGGMGRLIAMGGVFLDETQLRPLKDVVDALCTEAGVPAGTELKWSPPRGNWIRDQLKGPARTELYCRVVRTARELGGRAVVVVWDTGRTTLQGPDALRRVVRFLFERVTMHLEDRGQRGLIVADRPSGGGRKDEDALLEDVVGTLERGTDYVRSTQIVLNLVTTPSHLSRHLQVADLIVGCATSMVAGDGQFAPPALRRGAADARRERLGVRRRRRVQAVPEQPLEPLLPRAGREYVREDRDEHRHHTAVANPAVLLRRDRRRAATREETARSPGRVAAGATLARREGSWSCRASSRITGSGYIVCSPKLGVATTYCPKLFDSRKKTGTDTYAGIGVVYQH